MKKSTLLSLATVGTIVATSIGTFAAWDTTEAKTTGTVNFGTPVTVTADSPVTFNNTSRTLGTSPEATSEVKFVVADGENLANKLKLTSSVTSTDVTDVANKVDVVIIETSDPTKTSITEDTTLDRTPTGNSYTVTVKPKASLSDEELATLNNKAITVEITGTLE